MADVIYGHKVTETIFQYLKNKKETECAVWDDGIRKNSMGSSAGTDKPQDADDIFFNGFIEIVDKIAIIIGMYTTVSFAVAAWTRFLFGAYRCHAFFKI